MQLKKAERKQVKLKVGLFGSSGSGKTMSALRLAYGLCNDWNKIIYIDTEFVSKTQTSSELYAGFKGIDFEIGIFPLIQIEPPYGPERFTTALRLALAQKPEVIILDSISHEWEGQGGCLDLAKKFNDWKHVGEKHTEFIEVIKQASCHVISCGRTKTKYDTVKTEKQGKETYEVKKMGVGVITREGFDYEMILAFDIDQQHYASTSKDRTGIFIDRLPFVISEKTGQEMLAWAESGTKPVDGILDEVMAVVKERNIGQDQLQEITGFSTLKGHDFSTYQEIYQKLTA